MLLKKTLIAAAALAVATFALTNSAAAAGSTATANFQVLITIKAGCTVVAGSASNINLGTVAPTAVNTAGNSTINVTCSKTTPYYVGLAPSNASTTGAGVMVSTTAPATNTDKVPYQLYSAAGTSAPVWGNTATSTTVGNGVAGTGTGNSQSIPVYAIAPGANYTPDAYADTVTVNVNF